MEKHSFFSVKTIPHWSYYYNSPSTTLLKQTIQNIHHENSIKMERLLFFKFIEGLPPKSSVFPMIVTAFLQTIALTDKPSLVLSDTTSLISKMAPKPSEKSSFKSKKNLQN